MEPLPLRYLLMSRGDGAFGGRRSTQLSTLGWPNPSTQSTHSDGRDGDSNIENDQSASSISTINGRLAGLQAGETSPWSLGKDRLLQTCNMAVPLIIPPTSPLITAPGVVVLDASWLYEPDPPTRNAYEEFLAGPRFPNAQFWDLDAVSEPHPDGYALMLPSPERFAAFAGKHGISRDTHVIVYDGEGVFAAPRTAWTFKVYGHEKVSVINGGLPRARKEGVELETGPPSKFQEATYPIPTVQPGAVVEFDEVLRLTQRATQSAQNTFLIDARPVPSYESGHIPSSLVLDFPSTLAQDPKGFTYLREPKELSVHVGEKLGSDTLEQVTSGKATVVNTCGGGLSAAINWLIFQSLGVDSRLYDEAWGGYSAREGTPKVVGPNPL